MAALAMLYKLGIEARKSWRRLREYQQLALLCDGVKFINGIAIDDVASETKLAA